MDPAGRHGQRLDFEATKQYVLSEINGAEAVMKEGFAPSEQYAGPDGQGTWTDVYALAAVYYYMITGVKPISASNAARGHCYQRQTWRIRISRSVSVIC